MVAPQPRAIVLRCEPDVPRDADEILGLQPRLPHAVGLKAGELGAGVLRIGRMVAAVAGRPLALPGCTLRARAGRVAIAEVQPQRAVGAQRAADFAQPPRRGARYKGD